jgi:hypothetical protein
MCRRDGAEKIVQFQKVFVHGLAMEKIAGDKKAVYAEITTLLDDLTESCLDIVCTVFAPGLI